MPTEVPLAAFSSTAVAGQGQVGRRLVDVADVDREGLGVGQAAGIGDPNRDVVGGGALEVEQGAVGDGDLAGGAVDGEAPAGVVRQGIGGAVAGIRVRGRDRADRGAVGGVLVNGVGREVEIGRRLVLVPHADREGLRIGQAAAVGDPHRDVVAGRVFEVQQRTVGDRDLTAGGVDGEAPAGIVRQGVGRAVARVRIGRGNGSDRGAVGGVLVMTELPARARSVGASLASPTEIVKVSL